MRFNLLNKKQGISPQRQGSSAEGNPVLGGTHSVCGSVCFCCHEAVVGKVPVGIVGQQKPSVQYLPFFTQIWDMSDEETI